MRDLIPFECRHFSFYRNFYNLIYESHDANAAVSKHPQGYQIKRYWRLLPLPADMAHKFHSIY